MNRYFLFLLMVTLLTIAGYMLWPFFEAYLPLFKHYLIQFRAYSHTHTLMSYVAFSCLLSAIILTGIPLVTFFMLTAGVFYGFWEATTIVTLSRLLAAVAGFLLARRLFLDTPRLSSRRTQRHAQSLALLEKHPYLGLFLVRLAPLPDGLVNYSSAATPINYRDYLWVSLLGMIPFTLFCVWTGQQLGNISSLIRFIQ